MRAEMPAMKFAVCGLALAVCLAASRAEAQIIPVSQSRTVSALWTGGDDISVSAPDFGIFTNSVYQSHTNPGSQAAIATASQNSRIGSSVITASGSSSTHATQSGRLPAGESAFSVTFDLATTCSYALSGSTPWANVDSTDQGYSWVRLSGPGATIFQAGPFAYPTSFSTSGILDAGEYMISADGRSFGNHGTSCSFSLMLSVTTIPEPSTWALVGMSALILLARARKRQANG
jgi:hypothetical protein